MATDDTRDGERTQPRLGFDVVPDFDAAWSASKYFDEGDPIRSKSRRATDEEVEIHRSQSEEYIARIVITYVVRGNRHIRDFRLPIRDIPLCLEAIKSLSEMEEGFEIVGIFTGPSEESAN